MSRKIDTVLRDRQGNYMLPFFWQHGEDEETLRDYMRAIHEDGIGAVCVESRPHPDFAGPKWWQDMDVILDEARKRDMKVWILDDSHFPSGFANGALREQPDALRRQSIVYRKYTAAGGDIFTLEGRALTEAAEEGPDERDVPFYVKMGAEKAKEIHFSDDRLLAVFAVEEGTADPQIVDLCPFIDEKAKRLEWQVPAGSWRIVCLHLTRNRGAQREHINMMDRRSVRVFIDTVHEAHWQHYAEDFGRTIAGFFSDEPDLGNGLLYDAELKPGCGEDADFPWSAELEERLQERLGSAYPAALALLWENDGDEAETARVRYIYMDCVSRLVKECFSDQIGDWCRAHGVLYIGHGIEDNDITSRTGSALGHYFRGLSGQDMAGIDVIGGQLYPQAEEAEMDLGVWGKRKGAFFHYELADLASSAAAIEPLKKGRAMCETFGAYGWSEGVYLEKYLLDHLMVRGINHFVPHAFSPKAFPDPDCPPHFYAHGHNPQYRHFGALMQYGNRVCELLSDGKRIAPCAVAYDGESDWMGERESISLTAKVLSEAQISYMFLPEDVFTEPEQYGTKIEDGAFIVNGNEYRAFLVPKRQYITPAFAAALLMLHEGGVAVAFLDAGPACPGASPECGEDLQQIPVIAKADAPAFAENAGCRELAARTSAGPARRLKFCHYRHADGTEIWLIVNEDDTVFDGSLTIHGTCDYLYDPWENRCLTAQKMPLPDAEADDAAGSRTDVRLVLEPRKSIVLVADPAGPAAGMETAGAADNADGSVIAPDGQWLRSICSSLEYPQFAEEKAVSLPDALAAEKPAFSGFVRYRNTYTVPADGTYVLEISDAAEGVEVFADGQSLGIQIVPVFRYELPLTAGSHAVTIEAATTLEREMAVLPDMFGNTYEPDCGSGITGEVTLRRK